MTEKLYEKDSFLREFTGTVLTCVPSKKGFDITLDRTAFYPEGGGQPYDTGWLNESKVLEVHTRDGEIVHTCEVPLEAGTVVKGTVDWDRRFDLMQQHSGEHIVSGMAHLLWDCENVGFHLGAEVVTIDLSLPLTEKQIAQLESTVNWYLWRDVPVSVSYPSPQELKKIPYRSKKEIDGQVRIVTFPGADCCACCGTHVRSAGQVGLVKLLSAQKFREGVRIELVCGGRALRYLSQVMDQNSRVSHLLSAKPLQTGGAVERLLAENAALKSHCLDVEDSYFCELGQRYVLAGDVLHHEPGLSPDALRRLCDEIVRKCSGRCACFSGADGEGYKYAIGEPGGELKEFTKQLNQTLNGRGGGKPDFVQGSVQATWEEIEAFFRRGVAP